LAVGWGAWGKVAPKYRNNPAETWAGRGLKPRWLAAAIKSGKKMENFLIAGAPSSKPNGRKKARKPASNLEGARTGSLKQRLLDPAILRPAPPSLGPEGGFAFQAISRRARR
jgi:hypothetical protein